MRRLLRNSQALTGLPAFGGAIGDQGSAFSVQTPARRGLVFCLELAPMPENKGYRSKIRGFSSDFMDIRSKKSRAIKFKPKILIYAL